LTFGLSLTLTIWLVWVEVLIFQISVIQEILNVLLSWTMSPLCNGIQNAEDEITLYDKSLILATALHMVR